ncbi:glycine cleavage system protein H [Spiroplasma ixodetis]|uniref:glycine cleavage system protein H n=1 Tax=Spiroplasma ixodetis TaxID=2141 RepID=UPI002577E54F|nr:glycine cleavage system protein H [Spiroplasma ixodetis]WJG70128.1 glycine cleavage system H protein [Spiroplasma ixodetis Y32]
MKKNANCLIIEKRDNIYIISPTPKLQDDMGMACYVKYNTENNIVNKNDLVLTVEASKAILHARTPLAGKVVEYNQKAIENPTLFNSKKSKDNWILKLTDVVEKDFLELEDN